MERMAERARRDGEELRHIRLLNREGNEGACLDALGEHLSSRTKGGRNKTRIAAPPGSSSFDSFDEDNPPRMGP